MFSATLCANNECEPSSTKSVSNVKVQAEILTPSSATVGQVLELEDADEAPEGEEGRNLAPGQTMQKILRLSLKEEGNHTLGVTVTYTETQRAEAEGGQRAGAPTVGAKVRTFRKLYQFVAMPLLGVRTKAGDVPGRRDGRVSYAVEAQVENMGERGVVLEVLDAWDLGYRLIANMEYRQFRCPLKRRSRRSLLIGTSTALAQIRSMRQFSIHETYIKWRFSLRNRLTRKKCRNRRKLFRIYMLRLKRSF